MTKKKHKTALCQRWLESERGWGTRPDGFSLHWASEDLGAFVDAYWKGMPAQTPEEYSRPCGAPFAVKIPTGGDLDKALTKNAKKHGVRYFGSSNEPERL